MRTKQGAVSKPKKTKQQTPIKKFMMTVIKILTIFFVILFFAFVGVVGGAIFGYIKSAAPLMPKDLLLKGFTTHIYDINNKVVMGLSGDKNRELVESKDIPKYLKDAFVAIEDKRFYEHNGIDFIRIGSAILNFLKPGASKFGASTITQQVVKNLTGQEERSLKRKVQEQWRAIELEKHLTKDEILELYLNLIYMGENCYGVQAASKVYFNKNVKDITLAESASLAGITNRPAQYDPFTAQGKDNNIKRQKIILKEMLNLGYIRQEEYDNAIKQELVFSTAGKSSVKTVTTFSQPYFVDQVVLDVKKDLMAKGYSEEIAIKTIYNNGLKIYTTCDIDVQKAMDEVFTNDNYFTSVRSGAKPQAAMVILDAKNGQIRAIYGGAGKKIGSPLNRATSPLMQRQPGSTFKPIAVYGPAINERKITAATVVDDVPVYMLGADKKRYPENYDHIYNGLTPIRDAIRRSVNVVAAKVWNNYLGPDLSLDYLKKVNINRDDEKYVSLALGGLYKGVSPLQIASAYVPFTSKGMYYEPITYTKVEDMDGNILLEKTAKSNTVYDEATAYIMTDMLRGVVTSGTGYPYGLIKGGSMPSAGKTGTTSDNKDKWFAGYSPYYVGVTWYGYDQPTTISGDEANRALSLWHDVMEKVHKNLQPIEFNGASSIVRKTVCKYSGKVPTQLCYNDPRGSSVREEIFIKGTEPSDSDMCDVHITAKVCSASKDEFGRHLLYSMYCPAVDVISQVFIHRREQFYPIRYGDPYPTDWIYEVPEGKCNVHGFSTANKSTPTPNIPQLTPESVVENG